jgi:prepilin peptidase CpaA
MHLDPALPLLLLLVVLLLIAAWGDIRTRTIPNWLNGAVAILAIGWWWAEGMGLYPEIAMRIAIAVAVFILFAIFFAIGAMGGGDVKLIAALALWLTPPQLVHMLMGMAVGGGVLTLAMLLIHRLRRQPGRPEIPYGVAISAATLLTLSNDILTNFAS